MRLGSKLTALAAAVCLTSLAGSANAADITVVATGGPMPEVMGVLGPMFEKASGHKVNLSIKAAPAIIKEVKEGASIAKVMQSRVGLGVRTGASKPDISTSEALKATLLAAKNVAYSQGASGQFFTTVIAKLGIGDALKPKTIIVSGRPVGAAVASGEAEVGIQQVAELVPVAGVTLVGALPMDVNKIIGYSVGIPGKAKEMDAAKALARFIASPEALAAYKQKGMEPAS